MDKSQLRRALREPVPDLVALSSEVTSGLFTWLSIRLPATISTYAPLPDEVDVSLLRSLLPGWRWVLPRVENDGTMTFRDAQVDLETHKWGMRQPVDRGPAIPVPEIDLFLLPGLAFDHTGERLGRGGGYYDRVLEERATASEAIGVTVSGRVLEKLPVEDHDRRVDWLATEHGVSRCRPSS